MRTTDLLLRFVERFALVLTDSGLPRMPARVFAYVLADDAERYTAAELAAGLQVSHAAISGAVRHLVQSGYLARERVPGHRTDSYRIYDNDVWGSIILQQDRVLQGYEQVAAEGARLLDGSPGGRRLRETQEFFAFIRAEQPRLIARWQDRRRGLRDNAATGSARPPAGTAGSGARPWSGWPFGDPTAGRHLTRDQERSLWLHRAVAGKLALDPEAVLARARANLDRLWSVHRGGRSAPWLARWAAVLEQGATMVLDVLTSREETAVELRQNSPFAGILTEPERQAALSAFHRYGSAGLEADRTAA